MSTKYVIKSEDDLKNHFHGIHDFIRNKFGFYGKTALQFFNFLFVLKLIEPMIKDGQFKSLEGCIYSDILKQSTESERAKLLKDYRAKILKSPLRDTIFMFTPFDDFNESQEHIKGLLERIEAITEDIMEKYHVQGRIYEYFLGFVTQKNKGKKGGSQIDDLGQYFTSRNIIRYCVAKIDPELEDNKVPSMGDFFCGSGGFITEYIRFLNNKYEKINWGKNIKNIYGSDTDREIIKSARIDIMLLTGLLNDKNNDLIKDNIRRVNSTFDEDFDDNRDYVYVKYNFTNPPYGGDKGDNKLLLSTCTKEIKHIAETGSINFDKPPKNWKPTKSKSYLINGDNKETIALLHGMSILEKNGVYCGVLKEGVFFDGKFTDLRNNLIENYEVDWVISVPQSDFWNTSTKTSILIFRNTGNKTKEIKFCELKEIKDSNNFNEVNPQTQSIISEFIPQEYEFKKNKKSNYLTVKYEEIKEQGYSLNFKDYIKQNINVNEGFKIVKLGDICEMKSGFAFKSEEFIEKGIRLVQVNNIKDNYITKKDEDKFIKENSDYDKYIINKGDIIIAITGSYGDKIAIYSSPEKAYLNQNMFILTRFKNENLSTYVYLYWIYSGLIDKIKFNANGSTLKFITKDFIKNLEIPIPEDINTIKLYLDYLNPANQSLQSLQTLQTQKEQAICGLIKMLTSFGKDGVDWDEYKLGEVCEIKAGKYYTKDMSNTGEYPFYNASINNPIGTHYEYCFDGDKYLVIFIGGNTNADTIGNLCLCRGKIASTRPTAMIYNYNKSSYEYLFYYLRSIHQSIKQMAVTSVGLGWLNFEKMSSIKIRILKPHIIAQYKLQEEFDFMDKLKNDISQTLKNQEDITKQMMKLVLGGEDKKQTTEKINKSTKYSEDNLSEKSDKSTNPTKESKLKAISDSENSDTESKPIPKPTKSNKLKANIESDDEDKPETKPEAKPIKKNKTKKSNPVDSNDEVIQVKPLIYKKDITDEIDEIAKMEKELEQVLESKSKTKTNTKSSKTIIKELEEDFDIISHEIEKRKSKSTKK